MTSVLHRTLSLLAVPRDNPELLKAQYQTFSRQLPIMYLILVASTWTLSGVYMKNAPLWLVLGIPAIFTIICTVRFFQWHVSRKNDPRLTDALRALKRTNLLAIPIALSFSIWAFLLLPYGDSFARSANAFYIAVTGLACVFCLMHLRSAAIMVIVVVNADLVALFFYTQETAFLGSAIMTVLVSAGAATVMQVNYRDFVRVVNIQIDTERREKAQQRLLRMLDDLPVAVMTIDMNTFTINYVNKTSKTLIRGIEHLVPLRAELLLGAPIDIFLRHPKHQKRILSDPDQLPHSARIRFGPEIIDLKISAVTADDGTYIGPMLRWAIVTKEVETEARIHELAHYDSLTGLSNRFTFSGQLVEKLDVNDEGVGLLFIDLDGFKAINDTRGHRFGDKVLAEVASRLRKACEDPSLTIGRLGGDEFAVITGSASETATTALADRIIEAISMPMVLGQDLELHISASIGIVLAPPHSENSETLLARADIALYAAKTEGKGRWKLFAREMDERMKDSARLEADLRAALQQKDELQVFYQPIVDIRTGLPTGREALLRWKHPSRGWVPPSKFIPLAEQSGLIGKVTEMVLNTACHDAAAWPDAVPVAVNIAANSIGFCTLIPTVVSALENTGLSPQKLELEVTETALLNVGEAAVNELLRLRELGVSIALDDFGTGYSSLSHLQMFPFDKIKIDGSFVTNAVTHRESAAVIAAVAELGRRLGAATVAEGVETAEQLELVSREGCNEAQGYLLGRPAPDITIGRVALPANVNL